MHHTQLVKADRWRIMVNTIQICCSIEHSRNLKQFLIFACQHHSDNSERCHSLGCVLILNQTFDFSVFFKWKGLIGLKEKEITLIRVPARAQYEGNAGLATQAFFLPDPVCEPAKSNLYELLNCEAVLINLQESPTESSRSVL